MPKQLDLYTLQQIAERTLESIGIMGKRVTIRWEGEDNDCTDGQTVIVLSKVFEGIDLTRRTKRNLSILTGVIQHEVIHWLQDLKACDIARREVNLPHFYANVIADILGEKQIRSILPAATLKHMTGIRRLTKRNRFKGYIQDTNDNPTFPAEAGSVALIGRFRRPELPYHDLKKLTGHNYRSKAFSEHLWKQTPVNPKLLPDFIKQTAYEFPELCQQPEGKPTDGRITPVTRSESGMTDEDRMGACAIATGRMNIYYLRKPANAALPGAAELASKIQMRLSRTPSTMNINAIGEINRRALACDADIPFDYSIDIEESIGRSVVICVDLSGSMLSHDNREIAYDNTEERELKRGGEIIGLMDNHPDLTDDNMSKALKVAQACTIAVRNENGSVIGCVFGDYALMSAGDDKAAILFPEHAHRIVCNGTSFLWLKWVWAKYPSHQVIVITDGEGLIPEVITQTERDRTVLIKLGTNAPETDGIASRVIELDEIKDLPKHMLEVIN